LKAAAIFRMIRRSRTSIVKALRTRAANGRKAEGIARTAGEIAVAAEDVREAAVVVVEDAADAAVVVADDMVADMAVTAGAGDGIKTRIRD